MRIVGIEALVCTEKHATFADSRNNGCEVLGARGDEFVDDVFTHFAAGFERLTQGELREDPLLCLAAEVGFFNVVIALRVTFDADIEEVLDLVTHVEEGRAGNARSVLLVEMGVGPLAVDLLFVDLTICADGVHEPDVFFVLVD